MKFKSVLALIAILVVVAAVIHLSHKREQLLVQQDLHEQHAALARLVELPERPQQIKGETVTVERDQTVYQILLDRGVTATEIHALLGAASEHYDLAKVRVGDKLLLDVQGEPARLMSLVYEPDDERTLIVSRNDEGFVAQMREMELDVLLTPYSFKVENSLWWDAKQSGLDDRTTGNLIEIFEYDIDFFMEQQPGDDYTLLLEHKYDHGRFYKYGGIVSAVAVVHDEPHSAVSWTDPQGKAGWYNLAGEGLRRAFLKAPLNYRRISSGYTMHRKHPILGIVRPHQGIDYAAPTGTPVRAVADGTVVFAGRKGGYGRYVEIRHINNYNTCYAHLSKYGRGVKRGVRVKQGQVIGYVGSSGMSTGPHLDFRMKKNGHFVNPLREKLPSTEPLKPEYLTQFQQYARERMAQMNLDQNAQPLTPPSGRSVEVAEQPVVANEPTPQPDAAEQGLPTNPHDSGATGGE
ncbi:MAG: M23 family metallopeptidase [Candidatus Alcyoniella australis]|nr:M23 family metallopeptidase [Candidatus Alcyoniella australis]